MRNTRHHPSGFTLIELLVVVAIIGLLMSLLLPQLKTAREQARKVKCLANLKSIGTAMMMYASDQRDWFPFEKRNWPRSGRPDGWVMTAFHYGGHPGKPGTFTFNIAMRDTFAGRPLNPYLYSGLYEKLETEEDARSAEGLERRKALAVFDCPSDDGGFVQSSTASQTSLAQPTHFRNGSSYDINYHWVWLWAAGSGSLGAPHRAFSRAAAANLHYLERANHFLERQRELHASRFIMLYEDPFDSAQWNNLPRFGWHQQWNRHSFLFLDGHAANITADPTRGNFGTGWKTASGEWYYDPDDPDYRFRDLD